MSRAFLNRVVVVSLAKQGRKILCERRGLASLELWAYESDGEKIPLHVRILEFCLTVS